MILILLTIITLQVYGIEANSDYYRSQELDITSHYWATNGAYLDNSSTTLELETDMGCIYCGDVFYYQPPPDDIKFIPSPPIHPSYRDIVPDILINAVGSKPQQQLIQNNQCTFCNFFYDQGEKVFNKYDLNQNFNNRVIALLITFITVSAVLSLYLAVTRRTKIAASIARSRLFKSNTLPTNNHQLDKNSSLNETISNSGVHLSDPCFLRTNRDKNLTSPIISDHVPHKKTSIPSKYWAQPGSIIGRTIRRIPNEYEVPSSRTNSTGTSSAVYADMHNENNQRLFSPYNLHTYAEVREVPDPNEHFHTSSNSSVMLSESNYDNALYNHGGCLLDNGGVITTAPNGSVQMSDFSIRPTQSIAYGQTAPITHHHLNQVKMQHPNQPTYEQPPQRAQIIITSSNQGVNPTLLNYKERIHNVI